MLTTFKQQIADLKLMPSKGGCFEFTVDGELVYAKLQTGKFPDEQAILTLLEQRGRK